MSSQTTSRTTPNAAVQTAQAKALQGGSTGEFMIEANGIEICTEAFGNPANPPLLLLSGACASMIRWQDDFCQQLVDGGLYVIRFDNRDIGRSTTFPPGEPSYSLLDLADDALGVLDAYGITRAHLFGASSGGMIAQLLAIRYPERVLTLNLAISTPEVPAAAHAVKGSSGDGSDLPLPSASLLDKVRVLAAVDWNNRAAGIEAFVVEAKAMAGSRFPVDENAIRSWGPKEYDRQRNILSFRFNTPIAETRTPSWRHQLKEIDMPTLVIAGGEDPVLPLPHSIALSEEIPGARIVTIEGMGHELPRGSWAEIIPEIIANAAKR